MLTEIHRQAADSPILRLATMARRGEPIPFGAYDDNVWKMSQRDVMETKLSVFIFPKKLELLYVFPLK